MTETAEAKPMKVGAIARVTRNTVDLDGDTPLRVGERFEVEEYIDAEQSEDGVPFYWGNRQGGMNNVCVAADAVEQVMSPAEAQARKLPTRKALLSEIAWSISGSRDGFEIDQSEMHLHERDTVTLLGTTDDGLRFAAVVAIKTIEHSDWF